jgi:hypothetical protein
MWENCPYKTGAPESLRDSSVTIVSSLRDERMGIRSAGTETCPFATTCWLHLKPVQPYTQCTLMALPLKGVKRPKLETSNWTPSSARLRMRGAIRPFVFMECFIKHRAAFPYLTLPQSPHKSRTNSAKLREICPPFCKITIGLLALVTWFLVWVTG